MWNGKYNRKKKKIELRFASSKSKKWIYSWMPSGIESKSTMGVMYQNPQWWGEMAPSVQIDCI